MESVSFAVAFFAGVLSFLSPCVLPLVPGYLGFITGMSLDDLKGDPRRSAVLVPALFFVAGFATIFLLLGASATFLGQFLLRYQDWISRIGGVLIVIFGLHLLGVFRIAPLLRERRFQMKDRPAGRIGAYGAGLVFGAGWTPCIGPVLGALLTYASARATLASGMLLLGGYAAGLAVPFILAALATSAFLDTSRKMRGWIPALEKVSGGVLVVVGVLLVSGTFTWLSTYFIQLTPDFLLERI